MSSQYKRSHVQTPNTRTIIEHKPAPTHCDITYQHFGFPPITWDPDSVMSQTAASHSHTYIVASQRHLLSSYPIENLLRRPPHTHSHNTWHHRAPSWKPPHRLCTGLLALMRRSPHAHSSSVNSRPLMNLTTGLNARHDSRGKPSSSWGHTSLEDKSQSWQISNKQRLV